MLYETVWLFFALAVGILISIGLLGLIFSPAVPPRILKALAVMISVLIILTGIYFSYQWRAQRKEIQVLAQQAEETIKQYLAAHQKKMIRKIGWCSTEELGPDPDFLRMLVDGSDVNFNALSKNSRRMSSSFITSFPSIGLEVK